MNKLADLHDQVPMSPKTGEASMEKQVQTRNKLADLYDQVPLPMKLAEASIKNQVQTLYVAASLKKKNDSLKKKDRLREEFERRLPKEPPRRFRLIDCERTVQERKVVLIDGDPRVHNYTAVSHTFGMHVYKVYDCPCAAICLARHPRRSAEACPGHDAHVQAGDKHPEVCQDMMRMCDILKEAGAETVWHDGICIAQHDKEEVKEAIRHMGWIYANAKETVIFLHYVGSPMAPIRHDAEYVSRWHARAWTLQESVVSKCRRYCVRISKGSIDDATRRLEKCMSLEELEAEVASWYEEESSVVTVIEEEQYQRLLSELCTEVWRLLADVMRYSGKAIFSKALKWGGCLEQCLYVFANTSFWFPDLGFVLDDCFRRDCKHQGDRINSILALCGVTDFVAPKEGRFLEASTITFFQKLGAEGLARALFCFSELQPVHIGKAEATDDDSCSLFEHLWVPNLSRFTTAQAFQMMSPKLGIHYEVLGNGLLHLTGRIICVKSIKWTTRILDPFFQIQEALLAEEQSVGNQALCEAVAVDSVNGLAIDISFDTKEGSFIAFTLGSTTVLGEAVFSRTSKGEPMLMSQEGEIVVLKEGESFVGHLIFAGGSLRSHPNLDESRSHPNDDESHPCLLVTGDFTSAVCKIGYFHMYGPFIDMLYLDTTPITILDELTFL